MLTLLLSGCLLLWDRPPECGDGCSCRTDAACDAGLVCWQAENECHPPCASGDCGEYACADQTSCLEECWDDGDCAFGAECLDDGMCG